MARAHHREGLPKIAKSCSVALLIVLAAGSYLCFLLVRSDPGQRESIPPGAGLQEGQEGRRASAGGASGTAPRDEARVPAGAGTTAENPAGMGEGQGDAPPLSGPLGPDGDGRNALVLDPPSFDLEFATRGPKEYGEYKKLLSKAQQERSPDSLTELLDLVTAFTQNLMLENSDPEDARFLLGLGEKTLTELEALGRDVSPSFLQLARCRVLLAETLVPQKPQFFDKEKVKEAFRDLPRMTLEDPVLERQRRHLLFVAACAGLLRPEDTAEARELLRGVPDLPPLGPDASLRARLSAARIAASVDLEYIRREVVNHMYEKRTSANHMTSDKEVFTQYDQALEELDTFVASFRDALTLGDRLYVEMLKRRSVRDKQGVQMHY